MDKIARVRQEIEKLYAGIDECIDALIKARINKDTEGEGKSLFQMEGLMVGTQQFLCWILDTLSEEPDKSLEEAARHYSERARFHWPNQVKPSYDAFIAGADWQARQLLQGSPMPEDTVLFNKGVAEGRRLEREDMTKDGNVILAEEDFDAEKEKSMEWGYNLCKQQMLKEALEGYVAQRVQGKLYAKAPVPDEMGLKFGDKVRIVVLKEEE